MRYFGAAGQHSDLRVRASASPSQGFDAVLDASIGPRTERCKTPPEFMCPNTAIDKNPQAARVAQPQHGMAPRFVVYAATKDVDEQ